MQHRIESASATGSEIAPNDKLAVGVGEAAEMISVGKGTIRQMVKDERLPRVGGFRKILVPVEALREFVNQS